MVCPTPVSYYLPKRYEDLTASEKDNIDNINEYLDAVIPIDAYGALMEHKSADIYQRNYHHWSPSLALIMQLWNLRNRPTSRLQSSAATYILKRKGM